MTGAGRGREARGWHGTVNTTDVKKVSDPDFFPKQFVEIKYLLKLYWHIFIGNKNMKFGVEMDQLTMTLTIILLLTKFIMLFFE